MQMQNKKNKKDHIMIHDLLYHKIYFWYLLFGRYLDNTERKK